MQFGKKKDGRLRQCVNHRALHKDTVNNQYPLPPISDMPNWLHRAQIITLLDLRNAARNNRTKKVE